MENKNYFRRESLKQLRKVIKRAYKKDKLIVSELYRYIQKTHAKSIMLYLPLKSEVNLYPLIAYLRKQRKEVYVPFMEGESFRLVKYRLPLHNKQFGIKETNNSNQFRKKKIDIAIVPIVGVDSTLRRVGFGKGMYDRFFEKEIKNINQVIFVARELCYSEEIITNHYDVQADMIITS